MYTGEPSLRRLKCTEVKTGSVGAPSPSMYYPLLPSSMVFTVICWNTEKSSHFYEKCNWACIKEITSRKNEHLILCSTNFSPNTGAFCTGSSAVKQLWLMTYTGRKTYSKALYCSRSYRTHRGPIVLSKAGINLKVSPFCRWGRGGGARIHGPASCPILPFPKALLIGKIWS